MYKCLSIIILVNKTKWKFHEITPRNMKSYFTETQGLEFKSGIKLGLLSSFQVESWISNAKFNLLSPQKNFEALANLVPNIILSLYPEICIFDGSCFPLAFQKLEISIVSCTFMFAGLSHQYERVYLVINLYI